MISNPKTCPFCQSERLVTGKLTGGLDEGAYIELAGVSITFLPAELGRHVNAVIVDRQANLCLGCGMSWARAEKSKALTLITKFGSEDLKRIAADAEAADTQAPPAKDES